MASSQSLLLACAAVSVQAEPIQTISNMLQDSQLKLLYHNMYMNSDIRNNAADEQSYQEEWAHGVWVEYQSGFTGGPVGFGVDAQAYVGFKLNTGDGTNGWGLLPVDGDGNARDQYGELGGAVKMCIGQTLVKWGEMKTDAPVFDTGEPGLLPETTEGVQIISHNIENMMLEAGHYTAFNNAASTNDDDELAPGIGSGKAGDAVDLAGFTYQFGENTSAQLYTAHYDDTWNQHYANFNHTVVLSEEQSLNIDVDIYRTVDSGENYQGNINNTAYSAALTYTAGAHTLAAGYQAIHGDTPFDYIGDDTIRLSNSMELSDFNAPNEKSFRVGYELDMSMFGCKGVTFSAGYGRGDNVDGTNADPTGGYADVYGKGGSHWERDVSLEYVMQDGVAKDLSITLIQSTLRSSSELNESDIDEVQLIFHYPMELL